MLKHISDKIRWLVARPPERTVVRTIADSLGILPTTAGLLALRGYTTPETASTFLRQDDLFLHDPFTMVDMPKAVERIERALRQKEKILIYGDYDVDGVTSVTILYSYLKKAGADVVYHIPNRIGEGYGINLPVLRQFAEDGYTLMITVDTGVTAIEEIKEAKSFGLETVVTDHHECRPELPEAEAVVNPRRDDCPYAFKALAGVGVAYKLLCALESHLFLYGLPADGEEPIIKATRQITEAFGEFVAIGTIADVMPLIDENRVIVSFGLYRLQKTENCGLRSLMFAAGVTTVNPDGTENQKKKITSTLIGFTLAPRINAAGRISNASFAVELFLTDDPVRADEIAAELCEANRRRQAEENNIIAQAEEKILSQCSADDAVIVLDDDHWHHGVIGIVASRLMERYHLPTILVSFEGSVGDEPSPDDVGKGSGRSIQGLNLVEALEACRDTLVKYGGHELAAGLSVTRGDLPLFKSRLNACARAALADHPAEKTFNIDMILSSEELSLKLAEELYLLEPYGVSNAQPMFETDCLTVTEIQPLAGGKHTKLTLCGGNNGQFSFCALYFGIPTAEFSYAVGDRVDLAYHLEVNQFRGRKSLQLMVCDLRPSGNYPRREAFSTLYRALKWLSDGKEKLLTDLGSLAVTTQLPDEWILPMLSVFEELAIVTVAHDGEQLSLSLPHLEQRMNLEDSQIYQRMKMEQTL